MSLGTVKDQFDSAIFRCKDGSETPPACLVRLVHLHAALVVLRDFIRSPDGGAMPAAEVHILSGYRSPAYNALVGGEKASKHMLGEAADITVPGLKPGKVQAYVDKLQRDGRMPKGGMGKYPGFTHCDVRGENARWVGK